MKSMSSSLTKNRKIKMAEGTKIHVCVVDGLHADLAKTGVPLSICLLLQQQGLLMDSAQWSAKQTATGFSVSFFWPRQCAQYGPKSGGHGGRRRKRKRKGLKRKSGTTAITSDAAAANPIGCTAKRETGSPINAPQADQHPALSSSSPVELQPANHSDSNTSMCSPPLVNHSDYDGECVEQAVDLNACTAVEYEQKDDAHGVRFICDEKEGWTKVIGKRSQC